MNPYEKIKDLTRQQGISVRELEKRLGYSNGYFSKWKTVSPNSDGLSKVADYFNVSVDYLLGRNQAPEWADEDDLIELDKLLESNVNMAYGGETLTPEEKQRVKDVMTGLFWEFRKRDKEK
ncbi:helix-turn-helix domain-containing protein [Enterococcus thailandicus]|uniref:Transcriptional regulator n=1 Tax=Enterococcus thailandicus TaxID=417368 RepID=A0A179ERU0_ENTTH|nr:helix-turn-helix transcriptional regulator [Enterococcus thailandicus]OAQ55533.1 transcriptional regulator [Enterococcus thailandicus]